MIGLRGRFRASARLDNLLSCFVLQALLQGDGAASGLGLQRPRGVGSLSAAGAGPDAGSLLKTDRGQRAGPAAYRALTDDLRLDNAHAIHHRTFPTAR